jgi:muramoyltetrapeptide carboxypeptidase LdcA involved in peptidoglycan recycling
MSKEFTPLISNIDHPELGSKIGIVASAGAPLVFINEKDTRDAEISAYEKTLHGEITKLGLTPHLPAGTINPPVDGVMWSNTAEERARHLINMLNDPSIEAIIQVKGGSCANDVAHLLDQYDRYPKATEEKIKESWLANHKNQELPKDFFYAKTNEY